MNRLKDGIVYENSVVNFEGVEAYDSITTEFCADTKAAYGDYNDHLEKGGKKIARIEFWPFGPKLFGFILTVAFRPKTARNVVQGLVLPTMIKI